MDVSHANPLGVWTLICSLYGNVCILDLDGPHYDTLECQITVQALSVTRDATEEKGLKMMLFALCDLDLCPPPLTSAWPHLRCDVGLEEGEYK